MVASDGGEKAVGKARRGWRLVEGSGSGRQYQQQQQQKPNTESSKAQRLEHRAQSTAGAKAV